MKRITFIFILIFALLVGCTLVSVPKGEDSSKAQISAAFKVSSEAQSGGMPEIISGDKVGVIQGIPKGEDVKNKGYCGNKNSKAFHLSTCPSVAAMKEENRVYFSNREEFISNSYRPCSRCNP